MELSECFEKGLLKKDRPSIEIAKKSIEMAKKKLGKARKLFELKMQEESLTSSYSAMFHAGRALLFKDGIREKSHYGLYVYLKEKFSDRIERRFLNEFDSLRQSRHEISYGLETVHISLEEAKEILKIANEFVELIEKIV